MKQSHRKALEEHNQYLKKLGLDKIKKRKNEETFVFKSCENRTGVSTGDRIHVLEEGTKKKYLYYTGSMKLLGIGLLHKSNLVPVWDETDAKEITKMRR